MTQLLQSQPTGPIDLESVEAAMKSLSLNFGATVLSSWINADQRDGQASQIACDSGSMARRAGRREKTLTTALGDLRLQRAYYHCEPCGCRAISTIHAPGEVLEWRKLWNN